MGKYDEAVKTYSPRKLALCKQKAKEKFIKHAGDITLATVANAVKVPEGYVRKWLADGGWHLEIPVKVSKKVKDDILTKAERLGLPDRYVTFAYHYIKTLNATNSALKAGYPPNRAHHK